VISFFILLSAALRYWELCWKPNEAVEKLRRPYKVGFSRVPYPSPCPDRQFWGDLMRLIFRGSHIFTLA
jgi:hypothetical protein